MKLLNVRQSNFELLRLLCIFGIVSMHTYGVFCDSAVGINLVLGVLINSIFNTGVSIFILISGYFGVIFTVKKYLKLELEVLFYSILSMVAISIINSSWDIQNIKKAFLPVATGKYWYITSYMMLIAFSEYINKVPEKLDKKKYEKLILLMLFIFSIIPTVVGYHVMNDSGKGFANMLLMYFIGRYIRLYWDEKNNIRFAVVGLCALSVGFVLNLIQSMSRGVGLVAPFARDYSIIIVVASVGIFMLFKQFVFYSNIINSLAKHVVGVYLFEGAVRTAIGKFFDIGIYGGKWYLFAIIIVYVLSVVIICILVDTVRMPLAKIIENNLNLYIYDSNKNKFFWRKKVDK